MKYRILGLMTTLLTLLATIGVASACGINSYQPEVPQILRK